MMQPMKILMNWLDENASEQHYMFCLQDFRSLYPHLSDLAFKTLISRSVKTGYLKRICRNLYAYKKAIPRTGLSLFHAASYLRSHEFNYISLETVLSDMGCISQVPMNWISIMSLGRSNIISCGEWGTIEFIHTDQKPNDLIHDLTYDENCKLWRASLKLALRDMKMTRRNCDLINWDMVNDVI